ncbi:cupredoxin family copper-binding protein [Streptomyces sp. I05A-00742]|uniref:cupredoxin domain-containing protein n=1 Tax=Streptomyces sp. I05A-00742 TaxID=2732853 RepID=UPI001487DAE5|nr:cupredoxin family copper-binding protein [Streptomyces sp. I05A-00742]
MADVSITDFTFVPPELTIGAGETVTWTNNDSTPHTVTADDGTFDSGPLNQGQTFSRTFNQRGQFTYHCSFHPSMTGTITVT